MTIESLTPDLHDGELAGIALLDNKEVELRCHTHDHVPGVLRLKGVERLWADNFLEGNIILVVVLKRGDSILPEAIGDMLDSPPDSRGVQELVRKAWEEDWTYFELNSSYGCELTALCTGGVEVR